MSPEARPRRKPARKTAVALQYDRAKGGAPKVVAKGSGLIAERLIQMAKDHRIPIREDKLLVEALEQLNVNQEIPPELYQVVAEILVSVYRAENNLKQSK
ncbi:MAG TPA: EscU/YscU/HrcU family type III secretion system export apparatus switch protein [bacterium]|nr:EscU/YscU/HrcU family type III secretion system export apparatus switch protein [bacterium]